MKNIVAMRFFGNFGGLVRGGKGGQIQPCSIEEIFRKLLKRGFVYAPPCPPFLTVSNYRLRG